MTTLLVVRHGQASFGAENYDQLSSLGIKQSRRLGAWLAQRAIRLDAVWCGPLQRQIDTTRHLIGAAQENGLQLPEPEILDGFREIHAPDLVRRILPQLDKEVLTARAQSLIQERSTLSTEGAHFILALDAWAKGLVDVGELESFAAFETRVQRALEHVGDHAAPDKYFAVITSAGPTAIAMRLALGLDPGLTMELGGRIENSSVTQLRFHQRRLKLIAFNSVDHLEREEVTRI